MMLSDILELTTKAKKKTLQNLLNQSSIHRERTNTTRDRHRQHWFRIDRSDDFKM